MKIMKSQPMDKNQFKMKRWEEENGSISLEHLTVGQVKFPVIISEQRKHLTRNESEELFN